MGRKKGQKGKQSARGAAATAINAKKLRENQPKDEEYDLEAINIAAVASVATVGQPIMVKMCRLCESKDGPFFNIFDGDKLLARKINHLLPLMIDEYDKLPHKICFRCSAKVEELDEFVQKCIKAQNNLKKSLGNQSTAAIARKNWEEKLKESKMSNDDYCESLIKKAMENIVGTGVDDIPELPPTPPPTVPKKVTKHQPKRTKDDAEASSKVVEEDLQMVTKETKVTLDRVNKSKDEKITPSRPTRSKPLAVDEMIPAELVHKLKKSSMESKNKEEVINEDSLVGMVIKEKVTKRMKKGNMEPVNNAHEDIREPEKRENPTLNNDIPKDKLYGSTGKAPEVGQMSEETEEPEYDIMQHVCTIKVGGAGYLFQCKLCKRNFLKKEVVLGHACAKAAAAKAKISKAESSKIAVANLDISKGMPITSRTALKPTRSDKEIIEAFKSRTAGNLSINNFSMESPVVKPKPGPASRKKLIEEPKQNPPSVSIQQNARPLPPTSSPSPPLPPLQQFAPSVEMPSNFPGPKNRYKLVPGPNNTFTLVEDTSGTSPGATVTIGAKRKIAEEPKLNIDQQRSETIFPGRKVTKAKSHEKNNTEVIDLENNLLQRANDKETVNLHGYQNAQHVNHSYPLSNATDGLKNSQNYPPQRPDHAPQMASRTDNQPYPVGLFQTIPQSSRGAKQQDNCQTSSTKKQSYTVVQTGNPSKLLISTKQSGPSQQAVALPLVPTKSKKGKKAKGVPETNAPAAPKQPFSVTLEDAAPRNDPNEGFFTFINVDPLLQPSYVLPTSSIIQESQITTSTPASEKAAASSSKKNESELYSCELCNMEFTREKKLLAHLQTHYSKDDEEETWTPSAPKKRTRKS